MSEMTVRVKVSMPPEFNLAQPYAELLDAATAAVGALGFGPDSVTYDGPPAPAYDLLHTVAAAQRRCQAMLDAPLSAAPASSGDVILELTDRVAALSEEVTRHYRARRRAEKWLAEIWRAVGASTADIDKRLAAMAAVETGKGGES